MWRLILAALAVALLAVCRPPARSLAADRTETVGAAADLATLQQACSPDQGRFEPSAAVSLRHPPSGFRVALPGRACIGRYAGGDNMVARYLIGVTATTDTTPRGIWTGIEATHTAMAMILDLAIVFPGAPPASLAEARARLDQELRALPEGALGRILPHLYRRPVPFPEPIRHPDLTAYFSLQVLETALGETTQDGYCVPFTVVTRERRGGSGAFSRMLGVRIPTIILRQRFEARVCVEPGGEGVLVSFSERMLEGDPGAEARGATLREAGHRLLASVTLTPEAQ